MSKAEDLLNGLSEEEIAAYTVNPETEPHIVIGDDRKISVPSELMRIAVQYDHNIETVTFDCPRYWDEHDMSTMKVYINYMRPDGEKGSYIATDISVDTTDENIMHFNWTVNKHVTMVNGNLKFLVCVRKVNADGNEENHWNSELCTQMTISEGLECAESFDDDYPDLYTQLVNLIEDKVDSSELENYCTLDKHNSDVDALLGELRNKQDQIDLNASGIESLNNTKVDKVEGKGLSTNDYTTAEKTKLAGIETGANKTVVDSILSSTSANPIRNSAVSKAITDATNRIESTESVVSHLSTNLQSAFTRLSEKADTSDLENYVPKSGATFDAGASVTFNGISDNRSTKHDTSVRFFAATDSQVGSGLNYYDHGFTKLFGAIGALYDNNGIKKYYMGPSVSNTLFEMLPNGDATFKGIVTANRFISTSTNMLLYSESLDTSNVTINIPNLFTSYSAVVCNAITTRGSYSVTLPLNYIKSLGTSDFYTAGSLLFYYVDDNNLTVKTGLGQSNPTISSMKVISLY